VIGLLGGSISRAVGGQLAKRAAKKAFSGGKNTQIVKRQTQGQEQGKSNAITINPKTALIPSTSIPARNNKTQVSGSPKSGPGTLERIDKEVLDIRNLLGKSIKEEKKDVTTKKKLFEKEQRQSKETKLENKSKIGAGLGGAALSKILPKGGIIDAIQNFIFSVIAGKILIFLFENRETVFNIVKNLAAATEFIVNLGGKILNGIISVVDGAYDVTDAIGREIEGVGGEDAEKEYTKFLGKFNKFINIAMILAMSGVPLNGMTPGAKPGVQPQTKLSPGGKPASGASKTSEYMNRGRQAKLFERKYGNDAARAYQNAYDDAIKSGKTPTQAARRAKANVDKMIRNKKFVPKPSGPGLGTGAGGRPASGRAGGVFRRGLAKSGSRLQTRIMGRGARLGLNRSGARLASKFAKVSSGPLGRIPIIGPLMIGIASYMEDGKLDRALFKVGGSALGGFLGSFIPIPFLGTIIGTLAGEYVGDLMYELLNGGGASAVGKRLKNDILKVVNGAKLFSEWMMKGISNIQKQDGPQIDLSWVPFLNLGKIKLGGWATLLNPLEYNLVKKFNVLRTAFFSESDPNNEGSVYSKSIATDKRGTNDSEGDESQSPGGSGPTVSQGSGRRSLPSGTGTITPVKFGDPNFTPGKTRGKDTQIYLHWTAGNYNDASKSYGYHTIFGGDGSVYRNKDYDVTGKHTEGKNGNSVGLSLAAMAGATPNNFGSKPVTHEQLNQMSAEAARLAIKWGWGEGDIDKNIWTHAEAGSGYDPRGLAGHADSDGDGQPDNYGPTAWGGLGARWDLWMIKQGGKPGSGGPIIRDMVKKHFRNFKAELANKTSETDSIRGISDADGPESLAPAGEKPKFDAEKVSALLSSKYGVDAKPVKTPTITKGPPIIPSKKEKETTQNEDSQQANFSSLQGTSGFTDIFAGAREHAATSAGQQSQFFNKPSSNSVSPSNITPVNLNSDDKLRSHADYEEDGTKIVLINQPYIIDSNTNNSQKVSTSGSKYYT